MRFSIWPGNNQPWEDIVEVATHAEATGWDRAYVCDHFMPDGESADDAELTPYHEATALVSALAASTTRIGLSTLVLSVTYRHPAVLANWAVTIQEISGGRLTLGLGAGWQLNEHGQYGIALGGPGERVDRFVEAIEVTTTLLHERESTYAGRHFQLDRALMEPKARIPLLLAGKGDRMLGVIARHADEWNMWAMPDVIAARRAELDRRCEQIGRAPAEIATSTQALWFLDDAEASARAAAGPDPRPALGGSIEQCAETVAGWRDVGVAEVIVPDLTLGRGARRLEAMDRIITELAPSFR